MQRSRSTSSSIGITDGATTDGVTTDAQPTTDSYEPSEDANSETSDQSHASVQGKEVERIKYLDGDFENFPEELLCQLKSHLQKRHAENFAGRRWRRRKTATTCNGRKTHFRFENSDEVLKASRFKYGRNKQILLIRTAESNNLKALTYIIKCQSGRERRGDDPNIVSQWDIWRPYGRGIRTDVPRILRCYTKTQPKPPDQITSERTRDIESEEEVVVSAMSVKRQKRPRLDRRSLREATACGTSNSATHADSIDYGNGDKQEYRQDSRSARTLPPSSLNESTNEEAMGARHESHTAFANQERESELGPRQLFRPTQIQPTQAASLIRTSNLTPQANGAATSEHFPILQPMTTTSTSNTNS